MITRNESKPLVWVPRSVLPVVWVLASFVLLLRALPAQCLPLETAQLLASSGAVGDIFAHSVSVSGDVAVAGAPFDDDLGSTSGSAFVYRHDPATGLWNEEAQLLASSGGEDDRFGYSVSVSGDVAVVGAYGDDDLATDSGSAFVYRYDSATGVWNEEAQLLASTGAALDWFGWSVSVSGDVAIVGASEDDDLGTNSGSAFVYRYDAATGVWNEEAHLLASTGAAWDRFGIAVSVSADVAVVGAHNDDDLGFNSGSAFVYRYDPATGSWNEEAQLLASTGAEQDFFGASAAVSGVVAIVGAFFDDDLGTESGSAFVYRYDPATGVWNEEAQLLSSTGAAEDRFGFSVSTSGDVAAVGAYRDDDLGTNSGSAFVYRYDSATGAWNEESQLLASSGAAEDIFGFSVSVSGDVTVVGAPLHDDVGSAFVYDLGCPPPGPPFRRGDCNQDGGFNLADPIFALSSLFVPGSPQPDCADACDTNDDGGHNLADAVYSLTALFINGPPPPAPFAACGTDPTQDPVGCAAFDPGACP